MKRALFLWIVCALGATVTFTHSPAAIASHIQIAKKSPNGKPKPQVRRGVRKLIINGVEGTKFQAVIAGMYDADSMTTVSGVVPATYIFYSGGFVSATVQEGGIADYPELHGTLEVSIVQDGEQLAYEFTSVEFGVVTVSNAKQ